MANGELMTVGPRQDRNVLMETRATSVSDRPLVIWVPASHPSFRALEAEEAQVFPTAPALFGADSSQFCFLTLVIDGALRHLMRLSVPAMTGDEEIPFLIKDLLRSGQGLDLAETLDFYASRGIDLYRCLSVETNLRIGDQLEGVSSADQSYLALFTLSNELGCNAIFAHLNEPAVKSLSRVGLEWEHVSGRGDLRTPGAFGSEEFDDDYTPVCIPRTSHNEAMFEALAEVTPEAAWALEDLVITLR